MKLEMLRQVMDEKGIGAGVLAQITGRSKSAIYRRFRGETEFTAGEIYSIASALGMSADEIMNIFFTGFTGKMCHKENGASARKGCSDMSRSAI